MLNSTRLFSSVTWSSETGENRVCQRYGRGILLASFRCGSVCFACVRASRDVGSQGCSSILPMSSQMNSAF